jgi:hypothetical protein
MRTELNQSNRLIIGFGHRRRRGKDLACAIAWEWLHAHEFGTVQESFAKPLKEAAGIIFGLTSDQLCGDAKMEVDEFWGITPREILQRMGTEAMRNGFDADIWVKSFVRRVTHYYPDKCVLIGDVRFPNEANAIHELGGYLVRLDRNVPEGAPGEDSHPSEMALDDYPTWDAIIKNDGTIDEFEFQIQEVVASLALKASILTQ